MNTEEILTATLELIRKEGWSKDGWGFTPPHSIRRALGEACNAAFPCDRPAGQEANVAAIRAIATAIGSPLGAIMSWEAQKGRGQQDVEAVLEKAIAGCAG